MYMEVRAPVARRLVRKAAAEERNDTKKDERKDTSKQGQTGSQG
jgi:hypothetical protein